MKGVIARVEWQDCDICVHDIYESGCELQDKELKTEFDAYELCFYCLDFKEKE